MSREELFGVLLLCSLPVFLLCFGIGLNTVHVYKREVRIYRTHTRNASCMVKGSRPLTIEENPCESMTGPDDTCFNSDVSYIRIVVSYMIDNGTFINSSMTVHYVTKLDDSFKVYRLL